MDHPVTVGAEDCQVTQLGYDALVCVAQCPQVVDLKHGFMVFAILGEIALTAFAEQVSVVLASKLRLFRRRKVRRPFNLEMGNELSPSFFGREIQIDVR